MRQQTIVTLGRETGSGGHLIAQILAQELDMQLFDKELIAGAVETSGYNEDMVRKFDEKPVNLFKSRRIGNYSNSLEENVANRQFEFMRNKESEGLSFVLVGRCGECVFRDHPNTVRIFVRGDLADKVQRIAESEQMSLAEAEQYVRETDRKRKSYHNYYCDLKWGDSRGYDLCVNSSKLGVERTADTLLHYIRAFQNQE